MVYKPIPCPKCQRRLTVFKDEYDAHDHLYVCKVQCDGCGYCGTTMVAAEWADD